MPPVERDRAATGALGAALGDWLGPRMREHPKSGEESALNLLNSELPIVEEHQIRVAASRGLVWTALRRHVDSSLGVGESHPLAWLLVNQILRRRRAGDPDQLTAATIAKIDSPRGRRTYARRAPAIEPVFAQIKHNRKIRTTSRRGLTAADSEWKLICTTHNLLKLYRLA